MTDDSVTRLENEFDTNDPNVAFSCIPFQDDDLERLVEMCSLEMFLLNVKKQSDPMLCKEVSLSSVVVP